MQKRSSSHGACPGKAEHSWESAPTLFGTPMCPEVTDDERRKEKKERERERKRERQKRGTNKTEKGNENEGRKITKKEMQENK
jgi:hypothetical protein